MKFNNLGVIKTPSGGSAWVIALEPDVVAKMGHYIAKDMNDHARNPKRCVIPEFDTLQSVPIVRTHLSGYDTLLGATLSYFTGWHFVWKRLLPYFRPLYYANSEGMRLIAKYGDPHKAFASL